jgi:hypothetical protein
MCLISIAVGSALAKLAGTIFSAPDKIENEVTMDSFVSPFAALDPEVFESTNSDHEHCKVCPTRSRVEEMLFKHKRAACNGDWARSKFT